MSKISKSVEKTLLFIPLLVGMYLFKLLPCIQVIVTSFREEYKFSTDVYSGTGISNYSNILSDPNFRRAIINTGFYTIIVVSATVLFSIMISWSLFRITRLSNLMQLFIFLPLISSDIAVGMSWRYIFSDKGIINSFLASVSLNEVGWLSDKNMSLVIFILYGIWCSLPFSTLLLLSSLQQMDKNILIAAKLDKASEATIFLKIGIRFLKPTILSVSIINCISSWLAFNGLFPLFSGLPGPYYNLYTVVYYIYEKMGDGNRAVGEACAAAVVLLMCISIFLIVRVFARKCER